MWVKFAEAIARKLIVLAELAEIEDNDDEGREIINASWGGALMKKALEKFGSSEWRSQELERHTVVETIVVPPVRLTVEPIPWAEWHGSVVTDSFQDDSLARHVFQHACMWAHTNGSTCNLATGLPNGSGHRYPIALQKFKGTIRALATNLITKGCLAIITGVLHAR